MYVLKLNKFNGKKVWNIFHIFSQDFLFTMTGNPYDVYLDADVKTEIEDPRRAYDNHTAYEIEVLRQICMVGKEDEEILQYNVRNKGTKILAISTVRRREEN